MKLKVNIISESAFSIGGHGVDTAFREHVLALGERNDVLVRVNQLGSADITHVHTTGPYGLVALVLGGNKKVVTAHVVPDAFVGTVAGAKYWYRLAAWYLKFFYNRADKIIAISEEVEQSLIRKLGIKSDKITVIPNTVDTAQYKPAKDGKRLARQKLGLGSTDFIVLSVGQINPTKRYESFLSLAKQFPGFRFIWIGGTPFKHLSASYKDMLELTHKQPANMSTIGPLEHSEVKQYYWAADVFIMPSNREGHPLAVLEAAAAGLPIVVRDIPSYDSNFGQDILRGTDKTFAHIVQRLHDNQVYYREAVELSRAIATKFDNASGAKQLCRLYRQLIASK
ncbi:MAG TPA: glycosyltransferase family 4 protein [Candidatus Dormibacteraeota bacterium]|nr:glycosyltransferase family 4 protein [Candidatus Dormibacteraeota bacterium]